MHVMLPVSIPTTKHLQQERKRNNKICCKHLL